MDVTYRPARPEDLEPGARVVEQAFNESQLGFRIEESMLMMAARAFGDWARYLPSSPGVTSCELPEPFIGGVLDGA